MGSTAIDQWPSPELSTVADGPDAISDAALAVEATLSGADVHTYIPHWSSDGQTQPSNPASVTARYRVRNGWCDVFIFMEFGAGTGGGKGNLYLSLPRKANVDIPEQYIPCKTYGASGGWAFFQVHGFGYVNAGDDVLRIWFPFNKTNITHGQWRSSDNSGAAGTSVPWVPGGYCIQNPSNFFAGGRYRVAPS